MGDLHGVRGGQERWMRAALPAGGGGGPLVDGEQAPADPGDDGHGDGVADGAVAGGVGDGPTPGVQRGPVVGEALEAFALPWGEPPDAHPHPLVAEAGAVAACGLGWRLVMVAGRGW